MAKKTTHVTHTPACLSRYHRYVRTKEGCEAEVEDWIIPNLERVAKTLLTEDAAVRGDSYGYRPLDGTLRRWAVSDGAEIRTDSLLHLVCEALGASAFLLEDDACDVIGEGLLVPAPQTRNQADFEASR